MEWVIWGFAALAAGVAGIIGAGAWVALRRNRDAPNTGVRMHPRPGTPPRSDPRRGVPKSR